MAIADNPAPTDPVEAFIAALEALDERGDRGALARLKRCAGRRLSECPGSYGLFYRLLPPEIAGKPWAEEDYFLVATLFPLAPDPGTGDLGELLRRAAQGQPKAAKGIERRLVILLDAADDELPFRLRQAATWLAAQEVRVDWRQLLRDVLGWDRPGHPVQKHWARSFFSTPAPSPATTPATQPAIAES